MTSLKVGELSNMLSLTDAGLGWILSRTVGALSWMLSWMDGELCWTVSRTVGELHVMGAIKGAVLDSSCRIVLESQFNSSTIHIRCVLGTLHLTS